MPSPSSTPSTASAGVRSRSSTVTRAWGRTPSYTTFIRVLAGKAVEHVGEGRPRGAHVDPVAGHGDVHRGAQRDGDAERQRDRRRLPPHGQSVAPLGPVLPRRRTPACIRYFAPQVRHVELAPDDLQLDAAAAHPARCCGPACPSTTRIGNILVTTAPARMKANSPMVTRTRSWSGAQGGAVTHQRACTRPCVRSAAGVDHIGEHHRRAAEHVVVELDSFVDAHVVLHLDVADTHPGGDKTFCPRTQSRPTRCPAPCGRSARSSSPPRADTVHPRRCDRMDEV